MRYPISHLEGDRVTVDQGDGAWADAVVVGRLLVRDAAGEVHESFEVRYPQDRRTEAGLPAARLSARPYDEQEALADVHPVVDKAASRVRWPVAGQHAGQELRTEVAHILLAVRAELRRRGLGLQECAQEELDEVLAESCLEALLLRTEPIPAAALDVTGGPQPASAC